MAEHAKLLAIDDLTVHFPIRKGLLQRQVGVVKAVDGVSFEIGRAETLGLVGESGCGKSTIGLSLMRLVVPTGGRVMIGGMDISRLRGSELQQFRRRMQIVFQDPFSSLNPRQKVRDIIRAPLDIHGIGTARQRHEKVAALMARVGLRPDQAENYPHQFSGGQKQRIGIARALALEPDLIICDEAVSALDVSVQAQILNLLADLQRDLGVAFLFISHDLGVVRHISHRVAVMYLGNIVEIGPRAPIFAQPIHPYTERLLGSMPGKRRRDRTPSLQADEVPSATRKPSGCAYHPRCPLATGICRERTPSLTPRDLSRAVACHHR